MSADPTVSNVPPDPAAPDTAQDPANETMPVSMPGLRGNGDGPAAETDRKKIDPRWREYYDALLQQRDYLLDQTSNLITTAREVNPDPIQDEGPAATATESNQRDQSLGTLSFDQDQLAEINAAIDKIETGGDYGICEMTGRPIPAERLKAIPWTRFTREAEEDMERRGQAPKAKLAPLGQLNERRPPETQ